MELCTFVGCRDIKWLKRSIEGTRIICGKLKSLPCGTLVLDWDSETLLQSLIFLLREKTMENFRCHECDLNVANEFSLKRHRERRHSDGPKVQRSKRDHLEPVTLHSDMELGDLISHHPCLYSK